MKTYLKAITISGLLAIACNKKQSQGNFALESLDISYPNPESPTLVNPTVTEEFMNLVNEHRRDLGLDPLIHSSELGNIAQKHSVDMANKLVAFGHDGFSARCSQARIVLGGGNLCAENVAMGQKTAQTVFNSWIGSAGHRANIEQPRSTHTGLGSKKSSNGTIYWTQIFIEKN